MPPQSPSPSSKCDCCMLSSHLQDRHKSFLCGSTPSDVITDGDMLSSHLQDRHKSFLGGSTPSDVITDGDRWMQKHVAERSRVVYQNGSQDYDFDNLAPQDCTNRSLLTKSIHTETSIRQYATVIFFRMLALLTAVSIYLWSDKLQEWVNSVWQLLSMAWWFQTVYFETVWTTLTYGYIMVIPLLMHNIPWFDQFKVDKRTTYISQTALSIIREAVVYMAPLALLDTCIVKKYWGTDLEQWAVKSQDWIQITRALPLEPPTVMQIIYQVTGGVFIFDAIFFVIHCLLHKYRPLYSLLHQRHHSHTVMHVHVTNQLSIAERMMLVLAANQALKILRSHPLSRAVFVPVFVGLLVDNHSGYDLPWGLQHLLPRGWWGGPRLHHSHHLLGSRHYQPFLTYLDWALERWEGWECDCQKLKATG